MKDQVVSFKSKGLEETIRCLGQETEQYYNCSPRFNLK